jgi:hypothetical protein
LAVHGFNDGGPTLSALEYLRTGDTNATIDRLETQLHGDVWNIHYFYKQHPERTLNSPERELLTKIGSYRQRFGFPRDTYNPSTDQMVAELLSMTNPPATK